jgi:hypothetical protein
VLTYQAQDLESLATTSGHEPFVVAHLCQGQDLWEGACKVWLASLWPVCRTAFLDWARAGSYQEEGFALGGVQAVPLQGGSLAVAMIALQAGPEGTTPRLRYGALETCLHKLVRIALRAAAPVHIPQQEYRAAEASWDKVDALLRKMLAPVEVVVHRPLEEKSA